MRVRELIGIPAGKRTVAVAMAHMTHVIRCAGSTIRDGIADYLLIGDRDRILRLARDEGVDLADTEILHETDPAAACDLAAALAAAGRAQVVMKGLVQTSTFLRSLLDRRHGLRPEGGLISQVSVFEIPQYHKALILTDPGINILPGVEEKVKMLKNAVDLAQRLGIAAPKVACIAPTEVVNPAISSTVDARALRDRTPEFRGARVDGPIGFDIAVSRRAAEIKGIGGEVAGDADIVLFPELDSANAVYKSLIQFAQATPAGLCVGLKAPVVLTSRSDTDEVKRLSLHLALSLRPPAHGGATSPGSPGGPAARGETE